MRPLALLSRNLLLLLLLLLSLSIATLAEKESQSDLFRRYSYLYATLQKTAAPVEQAVLKIFGTDALLIDSTVPSCPSLFLSVSKHATHPDISLGYVVNCSTTDIATVHESGQQPVVTKRLNPLFITPVSCNLKWHLGMRVFLR